MRFEHLKQGFSPLGLIGLLEEQVGTVIFVTAALLVYIPQIGGENIYGKSALQDVIMRNGNGMKGGHYNILSIHQLEAWLLPILCL